MKTTVQVEGFAELDRALAALGPEATKVGRAALRGAANDVRDAVKAAAPVGTGSTKKSARNKGGDSRSYDYGRLRDNIRVREARARADNTVVMQVTTGNAFWSRFLEYGTRKMSARPFFRPAWDGSRDGALRTLQTRLGAGIERAAKRLARTRGRN